MTQPPRSPAPKPDKPRGKAVHDNHAALPPHRVRMKERGQGIAEDERGQEVPADKRRALRNQ